MMTKQQHLPGKNQAIDQAIDQAISQGHRGQLTSLGAFKRGHRQRGVALVTVMFVLALVVIISVEMTGRLQVQIERNTNISGTRQAYWYAVGAETLVKQLIKRINGPDSRSDTIHLGQDWAKTGMVFPVDGGNIAGEIKDLQSCFNLNSLAGNDNGDDSFGLGGEGKQRLQEAQEREQQQRDDAAARGRGETVKTDDDPAAAGATVAPKQRANGMTYEVEVFQRLLESLEIDDISDVPPEYLAQRLKDWLDQDSNTTGGGGVEDSEYMSLPIPYLAANSLMSSVTELRLVQGFTAQIVNKIKPYVCVLPGDTHLKININTVSSEQPELLMAMIEGLTNDDATALISGAAPEGYKSIDDVWQKEEMRQVNDQTKAEAKKYFDVTTRYFELTAQTSYGDSKFYLKSKLRVNENKQVSVIARRFGVDL